ncbi:MAG: hypothetical protein ABSA70_06480 [Terriglobia bacterium]
MRYLPAGFRYRFLSVDRFVDFCKKCAVSTSDAELENLEKAGLLFPQRRIIQPVQYCAAVADQHHKGQKGWVGLNYTFDATATAQFEGTDRLRVAMARFQFPAADKSRHHPLDCPRRYRGALVQSPVEEEFLPWSQFMVEVGTWDGKPYRVNAKIDYYSYWQVYQLDAIQEASKPHFYRMPPTATEWEARISQQDPVARAAARGDFLGVEHGFNLLSSYIEATNKGEDLFLHRLGKHGQPLVSLSPQEHEAFKLERRKYARRLVRVLRFDAKEVSSFGRRLARLSHEYEERQKATLRKLVLNDLWNLGELTTGFLGLSRHELASNKEFAFFPAAFPDRWEQTKLRTVWLLDSFLKEYNEKGGEHLTVEDVKALVEYLDRSCVDSFFVSLDMLGRTGIDTDLAGRNTTHMALQRISSTVEILMARVIGRHPDTRDLVKEFLDPDRAAKDEVTQERKNGITRAVSKDGSEDLFAQNLERIDRLNCSFLSKTLLTAFLVRNLLSHPFKLFFDPSQESSHEIVRQLYFAILGVWAFAQKHYHDKVEAKATPAC